MEDRIPVDLTVNLSYGTVSEFLQRHAANISRGGIFIRATDPRPVGTEVRFSIRLRSTGPIIRGKGRVRWIARAGGPNQLAGMGIQFTELEEESRILIDLVVAQRGAAAETDEPPQPDELSVLPEDSEGEKPPLRPLSTSAPPTGPPRVGSGERTSASAAPVGWAAARREPRVALKLPIKLTFVEQGLILERNLLNLSRGGMFVESVGAVEPGSLVRFSLGLPAQGETLQGTAVARWCRIEASPGAPAGLGLQFKELSARCRVLVEKLLRVAAPEPTADASIAPSAGPLAGAAPSGGAAAQAPIALPAPRSLDASALDALGMERAAPAELDHPRVGEELRASFQQLTARSEALGARIEQLAEALAARSTAPPPGEIDGELNALKELVGTALARASDEVARSHAASAALDGQLAEVREQLRRLPGQLVPPPAQAITERHLAELRDQLQRSIAEAGARKQAGPEKSSAAAQAMEAILARRYPEAEAILLRAGPEHGAEAAYRRELGQLYLRWSESAQDRLSDAEASFGRAAELDPKDAGALVQLGLVQLRRGRHADAQRTLQRALERSPGFEPARSALRLSRAVRPWRSAPVVAAAAGLCLALVASGALLGRASRGQASPAHSPVAVAPSPALGEAQLGQLREEMRRALAEALAKLPPPAPQSAPSVAPPAQPAADEPQRSAPPRQARASAPKPSDGGVSSLVARGDSALRAGRVDDALNAYREALAKAPGAATAHRGMASVLVMQGKDADAKVAYQRYLQLAPNASDANRIRALLEDM